MKRQPKPSPSPINRPVRAGFDLTPSCPWCRRGFTLRNLQDEQRPWRLHNFGDRPAYWPLLGAVEELGELAHAHLKEEQGIRGSAAENQEKAQDAVADTVIFLSDYCEARGWDFQTLVQRTWSEVRKRDFKRWPKTGRPRTGK